MIKLKSHDKNEKLKTSKMTLEIMRNYKEKVIFVFDNRHCNNDICFEIYLEVKIYHRRPALDIQLNDRKKY